jgi:hypothetical protein
VGLEAPEMSENNIPHVVDTGASVMPHEGMKFEYIGNAAEMGFTLQLPKKVGCWVIGGNLSIYVEEKATDLQIKATEEMFGWKWKDGDFNDHCK